MVRTELRSCNVNIIIAYDDVTIKTTILKKTSKILFNIQIIKFKGVVCHRRN